MVVLYIRAETQEDMACIYAGHEVKNAPQRKLDDCCIKIDCSPTIWKEFPWSRRQNWHLIQVSALSHDSQLNRWKLPHLLLKPILCPPCLGP